MNSSFKEGERFCDVETLGGFLIGIFPP